MKKITALFSIILISLVSCQKDPILKPSIPVTKPHTSTCIADTSVNVNIYLFDDTISTQHFSTHCYAVVKCSNGNVISDTMHLDSDNTNFNPTSYCSTHAIPSNSNAFVHLDSTNPNFIEIYDGTLLLAKLSIDVTGATSIVSRDVSVTTPNGGVAFCNVLIVDPTQKGIFIYK